ncbi:MAG: hypothetical protein M3138_11555 [Actinomycetota bacterium]|nr:hypothetical protein [Actinomycetota bacterium]
MRDAVSRIRGRRDQEQREGDRDTTTEHDATPVTGVGEQREARLHDGADEPGDRQEYADLQVGERELEADEGPGGLADPEDQLVVKELDREEQGDRREGDGRASAERARQAHPGSPSHAFTVSVGQDCAHEPSE